MTVTIYNIWKNHDMMKKEYGDCLSLSSLDYEYIKPPRECQEDTCYGVWLGTLGGGFVICGNLSVYNVGYMSV